MLSNVLRDAELVEFAHDAVAPLRHELDVAAEILAADFCLRGQRRGLLLASLRHALAFPTWHSLTTNGINRANAIELMTALVETAAGPEGRSAA